VFRKENLPDPTPVMTATNPLTLNRSAASSDAVAILTEIFARSKSLLVRPGAYAKGVR
jgi:hypothetical protein